METSFGFFIFFFFLETWTYKDFFFLNLVKTLHSETQPITLQYPILASGKWSPHRYSHNKGKAPIHYLVFDTPRSSRSFQKRRYFLTAKSSSWNFFFLCRYLPKHCWCTSSLMGALNATKDIWFLFAPKWNNTEFPCFSILTKKMTLLLSNLYLYLLRTGPWSSI